MTPPPRGAFPWLTVTAILIVALSLRAPIVAPTPVLAQIQEDLGITPGAAGLITTAPVLMFAVLTPVAALVIRRAGAEAAVLISLCGVLLGSLIRALPGFAGMLVGMIVIGAAITIGNIVVPVIIRRDVPSPQVPLVTAAYSAFLNVGSLVTASATAPLAQLIGWPLALLVWTGITVGGIAMWSVHVRRDRVEGSAWAERDSGDSAPRSETATDIVSLTGPLPVVERRRPHDVPVRRLPVAWLLTFGFAAQSSAYYALTTWLPTIAFDELGLDMSGAGALASVFQGVAIVGAFLIPAIARIAAPIVPAIFVSGAWIVTGFGMFLAPTLLPAWIVVGAIAHAGGFVVIFTRLVRVARSDRQAAGMSALVQGVGYGVAAAAPPLIGAIHEASGGWAVPLGVIAVITTLYGVFVLSAHIVGDRGVAH